jgi:hypothetical protein
MKSTMILTAALALATSLVVAQENREDKPVAQSTATSARPTDR